ncbi:MAG: Fic family protein [Butyricicoccus sp.]|nr:Fic family protein [Butyricicoccus sp.]
MCSYGIHFAYHSGKIENNRITYRDTQAVFQDDREADFVGDSRTITEIRNAKEAFETILTAFDQRIPLTEDFVKQIQKRLTQNTYDTRRYQLGERPGEYKHRDYVTGREETGAPASDVAEEMEELLEELQDVDHQNALLAAAYFHAKFENIHPFADGNGRTGRLLMNYFLLLHEHPPLIVHEQDRKAYYAALEAFDREQEIEPLVSYLKQQLEKTWTPDLLHSATGL